MPIRKAINDDAKAIYELHIASIQYYCADFYPADVVAAWISSKHINGYQDLPGYYVIIVAEQDQKILGFGVLNLQKNSIDSIYMVSIP